MLESCRFAFGPISVTGKFAANDRS